MHTQAKALLTDDLGKDLASVEALIRKHEELERDISAIDAKLEVSYFMLMSNVKSIIIRKTHMSYIWKLLILLIAPLTLIENRLLRRLCV